MKIRTRIILLFVLSAVLSVTAFFLLLRPLGMLITSLADPRGFSPYDMRLLIEEARRELDRAVSEYAADTDLYNRAAGIFEEVLPSGGGIVVQVLTPSGKVAATVAPEESRRRLERVGLRFDSYSTLQIAEIMELEDAYPPVFAEIFLEPIFPDRGELGSFAVFLSEERAPMVQLSMGREGQRWVLFFFAAGLIWVLLVTLGVIFIGTRPLLRRYGRLNMGLEAVKGGDYSFRILIRGSDELAYLSESFNVMIASLSSQREAERAAEEEKRRILASLSHDLRTPLSSILGYAESLRDNPGELSEEVREEANIIRAKAVYMEELLSELLDYTYTGATALRTEFVDMDVYELIRKVVIGFIPSIREKRLHLDADIPEEALILRGDERLLARSFENLLGNSIKYVPREGSIRVSTERLDDEKLLIRIANTGPPIPPETRERVFEHFYRGEASRHGKGLGLGLTIARNILLSHGGDVYLEKSNGDETVFTAVLTILPGPKK